MATQEPQKLSSYYDIRSAIDMGAEGRFGRVYETVRKHDGEMLAFKVLRLEHLLEDKKRGGEKAKEDMWAVFMTEVRALEKFDSHPMVVKLHDCGFLEAKTEDAPGPDAPIISMRRDAARFQTEFTKMRAQEWRPYIVMEYVPHEYCTFFDIEPDSRRIERRFPIEAALRLLSEFVDLLIELQLQDFAYVDHKLQHTFWNPETKHLKIIDWNCGFFRDACVNDAEFNEKRVQDCQVLISQVLYVLLTGNYPNIECTNAQPSGRKLIIPRDVPGQRLLEPFINDTCRGKFKDAEALRTTLKAILYQYGIPEDGDNVQLQQQREAIRDLMREMSNIAAQMRALQDTIDERLASAVVAPLDEELEAMYAELKSWHGARKILSEK